MDWDKTNKILGTIASMFTIIGSLWVFSEFVAKKFWPSSFTSDALITCIIGGIYLGGMIGGFIGRDKGGARKTLLGIFSGGIIGGICGIIVGVIFTATSGMIGWTLGGAIFLSIAVMIMEYYWGLPLTIDNYVYSCLFISLSLSFPEYPIYSSLAT